MKRERIIAAAGAVALIGGVGLNEPHLGLDRLGSYHGDATLLDLLGATAHRALQLMRDIATEAGPGREAEAAAYGGPCFGVSGSDEFGLEYTEPTIANVSEDDLELIFCGTGFTNTTAVDLKRPGQSAIPGTDVEVVSENEIRARFNLNGALAGLWDPVATETTQDQFSFLEEDFVIFESIFVLGVSPTVGWNTGRNTFQIAGVGFEGVEFKKDPTVEFLSNSGQPLPAMIDDYSDTRILATVNLATLEPVPATLDLRVINADGSSDLLEDAVTVTAGAIPKVEVAIMGNEIIRTGRPSTTFVRLTNTGNVNARGLLAIHGIPNNAVWELRRAPSPVQEYLDLGITEPVVVNMPSQTVAVVSPVIEIPGKRTVTYQIDVRIPDPEGTRPAQSWVIKASWDQFLQELNNYL
jgi:hypothetical protein